MFEGEPASWTNFDMVSGGNGSTDAGMYETALLWFDADRFDACEIVAGRKGSRLCRQRGTAVDPDKPAGWRFE